MGDRDGGIERKWFSLTLWVRGQHTMEGVTPGFRYVKSPVLTSPLMTLLGE